MSDHEMNDYDDVSNATPDQTLTADLTHSVIEDPTEQDRRSGVADEDVVMRDEVHRIQDENHNDDNEGDVNRSEEEIEDSHTLEEKSDNEEEAQEDAVGTIEPTDGDEPMPQYTLTESGVDTMSDSEGPAGTADEPKKRIKKRVKRRKKVAKTPSEDDPLFNDEGSGESGSPAPKKRKRKDSSGQLKKKSGPKKKRIEDDEGTRDELGRYMYQAAPQRVTTTRKIHGPHAQVTLSQKDAKLLSDPKKFVQIRLPRFSPCLATCEVWEPEASRKQEMRLQQARYSRVKAQSKQNDEVPLDFKDLEPYEMHPRAIRVTKMPNKSNADNDEDLPEASPPATLTPPKLIPNAWLARWSDGSVSIHIGESTTLLVDKSVDHCTVLVGMKGLKKVESTTSINRNKSKRMEEDEVENGEKIGFGQPINVVGSLGAVTERWIAALPSSGRGIDQRHQRLRDIFRNSSRVTKTVQLLDVQEIAKLSQAQRRQEELQKVERGYRRSARKRSKALTDNLNAAFLDDDDDFVDG